MQCRTDPKPFEDNVSLSNDFSGVWIMIFEVKYYNMQKGKKEKKKILLLPREQ